MTVAVVGSGVQASVPDLRGVVLSGANVVNGHGNGTTDIGSDLTGGTQLATLIAGQGIGGGTAGIAPRVKILPIMAQFPVTDLKHDQATVTAAAIRYAVDHGAQVIDAASSVQAGFIGTCDLVLARAIAYAVERQVIMIGPAAGGGSQPTSCPGVVSVIYTNAQLGLDPPAFRQAVVDVGAPGDSVPSVDRTGQVNSTDGIGSDLAAALVAGEAALIRSRYPAMPWREVVQRIVYFTRPVKGLPVPNNYSGYGIVQIDGALNVAKYPVPAGAINPVYAAYQQWASANPSEIPPPPAPSSSRAKAAAGVSPPAGGFPLVAGAAVAVVVVLGGLALLAMARRRHRVGA